MDNKEDCSFDDIDKYLLILLILTETLKLECFTIGRNFVKVSLVYLKPKLSESIKKIESK